MDVCKILNDNNNKLWILYYTYINALSMLLILMNNWFIYVHILSVQPANDLEKRIIEAFEIFDHSGDKTVDVREVGTIIRSLGKSNLRLLKLKLYLFLIWLYSLSLYKLEEKHLVRNRLITIRDMILGQNKRISQTE